MNINLIYARSANGVIGKGGKLPWIFHEDLQRFKDLTMGYPVIMGRKTFESLPDSVRPLPGRHNLVLTSKLGMANRHNLDFCDSVGSVLIKLAGENLRHKTDAWVIGGHEIYKQFMNMADNLVVTNILHHYDGDTFMPEPDENRWDAVSRSGEFVSSEGIRYSHTIWNRPKNAEKRFYIDRVEKR